MDSTHFTEWVTSAVGTLRAEHGKGIKIAIIIDNDTWNNKLTPECEAPKRAWRKPMIADWLISKKLKFVTFMTKAELLEIAYKNLPPKEHMVDKAAKQFDIEISYVRSQNVRFSLNDVGQLANVCLATVGPEHALSYFEHAKKHEDTFKTTDIIADELENELMDEDEDDENPAGSDFLDAD
ncbi:unnamed protein product [Didymodactylos carnosus]|uniref:Uncharacterized protein n=1 Tax=Didymodactylos carnosus TaxID=1234261 RepID=A0A816BNE0_9BILA|nr:unnamed protein product [Didymodactylos carnosus]CAF1612131.1 unnamed protein product [Didymodactylos carnosus]CAF4231151.1 unnamed protein product [Didymodactylos carnosus]CAF4495814.1 unnamed protein product [Didymodactylos carnosus]